MRGFEQADEFFSRDDGHRFETSAGNQRRLASRDDILDQTGKTFAGGTVQLSSSCIAYDDESPGGWRKLEIIMLAGCVVTSVDKINK